MADIKLYGTLIRDDDTNTQKIVKAAQVEGGYFVCSAKPTSGTWQTGQLCYSTGDSKFYQFNGTNWVEKEFGTTTEATTSAAGLMSAADKANLDTIVNSFNNDDSNTTIDTVNEVLKAFENAPEGTNIANALAAKQDKITTSNKLNADKIDGLATVATSGSYNDLSDKPNNVVITDSEQEITGQKTFTESSYWINSNINVRNNDYNFACLNGSYLSLENDGGMATTTYETDGVKRIASIDQSEAYSYNFPNHSGTLATKERTIPNSAIDTEFFNSLY